MQSIFSCKMYRASARKDKIRAAINNPINLELVQQLYEDLDDEYKQPKTQPEKPSDSTSGEDQLKNDTPSESSTIRPSKGSNRGGSTPPPSPHADHHLSDMLKAEESGESEPSPAPDTPSPKDTSSEDDSVEESTRVDKQTVQASVDCPVVRLSKQVDSIQGMLNAVQDTAGVRSVTIKEPNELWIYYKDSINLNTVMEPVISALNSADYGHLNFNRLARTDNAIVFEIAAALKPVDPIAEDVDE